MLDKGEQIKTRNISIKMIPLQRSQSKINNRIQKFFYYVKTNLEIGGSKLDLTFTLNDYIDDDDA